jgi:hypothetical protein
VTGSQYQLINGPRGTFGNLTVAASDTLVKYTYYGDTDFNGIVNFDDYARIDAGFNNGGTTWFQGDFDLNGVVNFDDYALIDLAFNLQQSGVLLSPMSAVPEPAGAVVILAGFAVCAALSRRHRTNSR